jgi:antitoxin HigA-1
MAMKNPPHPGVGIKQELDDMGLTVAEAAKGLGVTRQQLYRVINGDCGITPEMAYRLEKAIGSTADFWLRLPGRLRAGASPGARRFDQGRETGPEGRVAVRRPAAVISRRIGGRVET